MHTKIESLDAPADLSVVLETAGIRFSLGVTRYLSNFYVPQPRSGGSTEGKGHCSCVSTSISHIHVH